MVGDSVCRYCWKGEPVLMTSLQPPTEIKHCTACGAERRFECQLMPPLIYIIQTKLHPPDNGDEQPKVVEFGTVLVYSCSASCWNSLNKDSKTNHFKEEIIIMQSEITEFIKV